MVGHSFHALIRLVSTCKKIVRSNCTCANDLNFLLLGNSSVKISFSVSGWEKKNNINVQYIEYDENTMTKHEK